MDELMIVANVAIVFGVTYKLFELFAGRKERIMLIEKLCEKLSPDQLARKPLYMPSHSSFSGLRLGCLLIGLGIGLLMGYFIVWLTVSGDSCSASSIVYGSCVLLGGGTGLLVSYIIENKWFGKSER